MSTKHKPTKNQTGAVMCRLGADAYIELKHHAKQAGVSVSMITKTILIDYMRKIRNKELVMSIKPRKP